MKTSESLSEFAPAFLAAQIAINGVSRDSSNPNFQSRYASLDACWKAVKTQLNANNIMVMQIPSVMVETAGPCLVTRLMHTSGEFIEGVYSIRPVQDDPQGAGSAITYARRYSLCAMVGLVADSDDDGNAASRPQRAVPEKSASPKDELRKLVMAWANCPAEESKANIGLVLKKLELPAKLSAEQVEQAIWWCKKCMSENWNFQEAVAFAAERAA